MTRTRLTRTWGRTASCLAAGVLLGVGTASVAGADEIGGEEVVVPAAPPAPAECAGPIEGPHGQEDSVVQEVLTLLCNRGVITESDYATMSQRYAESEEEHFKPVLKFWGDMRGRFEFFGFDDNSAGNTDVGGESPDDRWRLRYRLRLNAAAEVNDFTQFVMQLTTESDRRSANQTLSSSYFDADGIFIRRAYARMTPWDRDWEDTSLAFEFGRVVNPFVGKVGKDYLLWDHDISLAGPQITFDHTFADTFNLYANTGFYVQRENSSGKDPNLGAAQVGFTVDLADAVELGGRVTGYLFGSLTDDARSLYEDSGNVFEEDQGAWYIGEARGYLKFGFWDAFPLLVYGTISQNFSGPSVASTGRQNTAWGAGFEIGDKKKNLLFGAGWFELQANAFPAIYVDSDLFDGFTNRKGLTFYVKRALARNTELNLTVFRSWEIESQAPEYDESVDGARRWRLQADVIWKFE